MKTSITNINLNGHENERAHHQGEASSINSSLSSSSSSYSIPSSNVHLANIANISLNANINGNNAHFNDGSNGDTNSLNNENSDQLFVRVSISDQNLQKVLKFSLEETIWTAKQKVLATLAKEIKDGYNYGFYMPPYQGRAGKFLDDSRYFKEYSLSGPVANLEFKYKKRVYKFVKINPKELKSLNVKSNYKRFLDLIRTNQASKVAKLLEKGIDPNFHSDLGETPLTVAVSLAEPRTMIMNLYNGGAHLDFRSRDSLTPMHKSAIIGNEKAIKALLELGAFAEVRDSRMLTPLFYAILNSSPIQIIEHLLFNGSLLGAKDDNNWQEIHHACKLGLSPHLDHLIYYGCDINGKNNSGNTPLHVCAIHNQENCARILLFRGANRNERNLANQTPYDTAIIAGNQALAELIKNHRDMDVVPIKERPFYNTKRRSIYVESTYDSLKTIQKANTCKTDTTSLNTTSSLNMQSHNMLNNYLTSSEYVDWQVSSINSAQMPTESSNMHLKSRSISKLDETTSFYATANIACSVMNVDTSKAKPNMNSDRSSITSRSRSISSDDHGFGSNLSQVSTTSNTIEYVYPRKRLYPSIPNRTFICVKPFKPTQPGEIELKKGDIVELLSVGDSGYWEGRANGLEGWFKAHCVEEIIKENYETDSIVVKSKTFFDLIAKAEVNAPRTVVLQKGKKGFGFVLRGAKTNDEKFEPTLEVPALQFLESVDKDSNADKAGLKPHDFLLEINGVDVSCKTHYDCVKLIKKAGDTLALKVYTVDAKSIRMLNSADFTSTSILHQSPSHYGRSQSYYAASNLNSDSFQSKSNEMQNNYNRLDHYNDEELDKTIAQYDTNSVKNKYNSTFNLSSNENNSTFLNNKRLIADDASAASIRTRVPVRKPTTGEVFNPNKSTLFQKTNSVPNLTDHQQTNMNPMQMPVHSTPPAPPPPPPPPPLTNPPVLSYNARGAQKSLNCLVETSASNDTLVQEDSNGLTLDYEEEEEEHLSENANQHNVNELEYDQSGALITSKSMNNNLVLMINNKSNTSPLTPRQIKQRNNAKRCSTIPNQPNDSILQSVAVLNSRQESDLQFLKSQKFDDEFIQTTKDLFSHYPNAKISISVSVQTYDESNSTLNQVETNRQIEIDRVMFNKILESNEFINMSRTATHCHEPNYTSTHSSSSSSPYTSSSINSDQTPSINLKSEDLNEAIKKAANEHLMKKQSMATNLLPNKTFNSSKVTSSFQQQQQQQQNLSVKNELQRALENRLRKTMNTEAEQQQQADQKNTANNEALRVSNVVQKPTTSPPSPPLPPPPPPLQAIPQVNGVSTHSFPPPPSPQALHRLSSVEQSGSNQGMPPPPPPPLFGQSALQQSQTHQVAPGQTNANKNVKSMITNYQKLSDPRSSSDFGALIAQKAAEKRAKFQEAKPIANTVTFQPDGSKLFVSNNNTNPNPISKPSDNHSSLNNNSNRSSQPNVIMKNTNSNNPNSFNQRESPKKVNDLKATLNNDENTRTNTNVIKITVNPRQSQEDFATSSNSEIEREIEENEMNQPKDLIEGDMNRNESFINTASKLLEKVKQQNSSNQMISKINQPTFSLGQFGKNSTNSSSISIKH